MYNSVIQSLGNISDCKLIGISLIQELKTALRNNKESSDNAYILLKPIEFTNKHINDHKSFKIWNI